MWLQDGIEDDQARSKDPGRYKCEMSASRVSNLPGKYMAQALHLSIVSQRNSFAVSPIPISIVDFDNYIHGIVLVSVRGLK